jgi:hypothetical protein
MVPCYMLTTTAPVDGSVYQEDYDLETAVQLVSCVSLSNWVARVSFWLAVAHLKD